MSQQTTSAITKAQVFTITVTNPCTSYEITLASDMADVTTTLGASATTVSTNYFDSTALSGSYSAHCGLTVELANFDTPFVTFTSS